MKAKAFSIGTSIQWQWMGRSITGSVKEIHKKPVSKVIKGKAIKRNGSEENPAYLVESTAKNIALKLHSELQIIDKKTSKDRQPKMFS